MSTLHLDSALFDSPTECVNWNYINSTIEKPLFQFGDTIKVDDYTVVTKDSWSNESTWVNSSTPTIFPVKFVVKYEYIGDEIDEDKIKEIVDENVRWLHSGIQYLTPTGWKEDIVNSSTHADLIKTVHVSPKIAYATIDFYKNINNGLVNSSRHWTRFAKLKYGNVMRVTMEQRAVNWIDWFNREWVVKIFNKLEAITTTQTLLLGSTLLAKLTDEDKKIATDKGWTLA